MVDHFNLLLIHQTPHYVELLPGTLMSPSHTHIQYHRRWEAARPAMKEGHSRVKAEVAMLLFVHAWTSTKSAGDNRT